MKLLHIPAGAPLYTNTFLLIGENGLAAAIDPAADAQRYLDLLAQNGARLTHILLTHGHYDHVGAVQALRAATGAPVFLGAGDAGSGELFPLPDPDRAYTDGETLAVDSDVSLRVLATPGHSAGSVSLLCGDVLFSGDTLFAGSAGRTDFAGGDAGALRRSLARLAAAVPDAAQVLPGHDRFTTMGEERRHNPYLHGL